MIKTTTQLKLFWALLVLILLVVPLAIALDQSSSGYISETIVVTGGTTANSSTYQSTLSVDTISGTSSSSTYDMQIGAQYILSEYPPEISSVSLSATSADNFTSDNLSVSYSTSDNDSNIVYAITDWRESSASIAVLNMPFNTRVTDLGYEVKDFTSYNNPGVFASAATQPSWTSSGKVGGAYTFDGGDYFSVADDDNSLDVTTDFTITFWMNANDLITLNPNIISRNGGGGYEPWRVEFTNAPNVRLIIANTTTNRDFLLNYAHGLNTGSWHHVALTFDDGTAELFINGSSVATDTSAITAVRVSGSPLYVGARTTSSNFFNGSIDEVLIFNRVLSEDQIAQLYADSNAGKSMETLFSNETNYADVWSVAITPVDEFDVGETVVSNTVSIDGGTLTLVHNNTFANNTNAHSFNVTAGVLSSSGPSAIKNISITNDNGTCVNVVNTTSGNYFNTTFTCTGTPFIGSLVNITFCSYSDDCVETPATSNAYPNQIPSMGSLLAPSDGNSSLINRNVTFNWSAASDDDNDVLTYHINVTNMNGTDVSVLCPGFTNTIPAPNTSYNHHTLLSTYLECNPITNEGYRYFWQVKVCDSWNCSDYTTAWNFSITDYLNFALTTDAINFTTVGQLYPNDVENTTDDVPPPFVAENTGNIYLNVTNVTATALWNAVGLDTFYYQYKAANTSEANSFSWSTSQTSWNNFTGVTNTDVLIGNLSFLDDSDTAEIDVQVTVPAIEDAGQKSSTINFYITMAG